MTSNYYYFFATYQNKSKAMQILRSRLFEKERERQANVRAAARREQIGTAERSDRIRTYNFQQVRTNT